jgi:phospholipase C
VRARYDERREELSLVVHNGGTSKAEVTLVNRYSSRRDGPIVLKPGESATQRLSVARTRGWYDVTIGIRGDARAEARYAGHLEDGRDSISDHGMGGLLQA